MDVTGFLTAGYAQEVPKVSVGLYQVGRVNEIEHVHILSETLEKPPLLFQEVNELVCGGWKSFLLYHPKKMLRNKVVEFFWVESNRL